MELLLVTQPYRIGKTLAHAGVIYIHKAPGHGNDKCVVYLRTKQPGGDQPEKISCIERHPKCCVIHKDPIRQGLLKYRPPEEGEDFDRYLSPERQGSARCLPPERSGCYSPYSSKICLSPLIEELKMCSPYVIWRLERYMLLKVEVQRENYHV